jgi:hypothetical protein
MSRRSARPVTRKLSVKLTANFERNLDGIEQFLREADAPGAFDALLDELESKPPVNTG